jgi:glycosyltransferase involved in cell wall biosynthesis
MKILFISVHGDPLARLGSAQAGGQNNYVKQITEALEQLGHQVDVATHWNNKKNRHVGHTGSNINVYRIAAGEHRFVKKDLLYDLLPRFFTELEESIDLKSYDVIHTNYWLSGLVGLMIRDKYRKPLVHTSHSLGAVKAKVTGEKNAVRLATEYKILQTADRVIATTNDEKKKILKMTAGNSKVSVVSIGVNEAFLLKGERRMPEQTRFMFTGRLNQAKGIFVLLEAWANYLEKGDKEARLIIAGGGPEDFNEQGCCVPRSAKLRLALDPVKDNVDVIGPKSQMELAELYRGCTALIVPSFYESFGMVASEGQASGLPVIASRVGGLKDVVSDHETGLLFKNKNAAALADCMHKLATDRELNLKMGQAAVQRALNVFNWQQISIELEKIYGQLLE